MKIIAYAVAGCLLSLLGVAAAVACVYANPDADRVAVAMEQFTALPVDQAHWDTYRADAGLGEVSVVAGCWQPTLSASVSISITTSSSASFIAINRKTTPLLRYLPPRGPP